MEPWCWVRPDTSHKYQVNHGSHSVLEIETKMQGSCETCLLVCSLRVRTIYTWVHGWNLWGDNMFKYAISSVNAQNWGKSQT